MKKFVSAALATLAVVGSTVAAVPAQAHPFGGAGWHGAGWHGGGWGGGGGALVAGIAGLAVGAAIADHGRPYYRGPGYYYGGPGCWTQSRWDPYFGGYVPVRVCS